ncbi:hypothetical protein [Bythopirellula polymerisocia]|uniref:Uncharacterized protein n=1 Tax=Bythopirellula polymerisocia TaxID=2528003 RepID=A0A5C6D1E1_9BACT|nr:hypothetical protein [Bythopirellula polymerisocia]TWU29477.1 hypothetical protein Pla144_02550 [Bythopirellula polymerisocia]
MQVRFSFFNSSQFSWFALLAAVTFAYPAINCIAQELRIETDIFAEDEEEPLSRTVTLFDSNTVFDFTENPPAVAVFRPPSPSHEGQFILLDLQSEKRTEVSTQRITGLIDKLVRWARDQKDPLLKFCADPQFEESFDASTGMLSLTSEMWNYHVATVPADDPTTLKRYREFTDWYTRLNTMMHSTPPPGPRLELNKALEKHGVVPVEIRRTVDSSGSTLRAVHLFTWRLSREDRARLEEVRRHLATFEKVDNAKFIAQRFESELVRGQSE